MMMMLSSSPLARSWPSGDQRTMLTARWCLTKDFHDTMLIVAKAFSLNFDEGGVWHFLFVCFSQRYKLKLGKKRGTLWDRTSSKAPPSPPPPPSWLPRWQHECRNLPSLTWLAGLPVEPGNGSDGWFSVFSVFTWKSTERTGSLLW